MTGGDIICVILFGSVVGAAFATGPYLPDFCMSAWRRLTKRRKVDDWGPRPNPPLLSRWTKCPGCGAVFAYVPIIGGAPICRRCEEERP